MLPTTGGYTLAAGATGAYNGYFTALAQNLVNAGMGTSIIRLGWEFNSSSNPWYAAGQPSVFVAYWKEVVDSMRAVPGADFSFEWSVAQGDNGSSDVAMGNYDSYYPGNDFVDIIGMDIYDETWQVYPGAAAEFQDIETQTWGLNWLATFASEQGKPIAIPEFGLGSAASAGDGAPFQGNGEVSGGDDPIFINQMANWIANHNVQNAVYFGVGNDAILNGQNPLTASALRADFGDDA
jgi:hypothetical protein